MAKRTIQPHRNPKVLRFFLHQDLENPGSDPWLMMDYENSYRRIACKANSKGQRVWADMANQKLFKCTLETKGAELIYHVEVDGQKGFYHINPSKDLTRLQWIDQDVGIEERITATHEHYLCGRDTAIEIRWDKKGGKPTRLDAEFVLEGYQWPMIALCLHRFISMMKL